MESKMHRIPGTIRECVQVDEHRTLQRVAFKNRVTGYLCVVYRQLDDPSGTR